MRIASLFDRAEPLFSFEFFPPKDAAGVERLFQTLQDRLCKAMRLQGIDNIEQANSWLAEYLREHNRRFAVAAHNPEDMHRPWAGTEQELAHICSLHHQRQLSAQGACKFEGQILQLLPGQAHAPKARAMINIAQYADGTLDLSYAGKPLAHRSFAVHDPQAMRLPAADHKTINERVDKLNQLERNKLLRLKAELAYQDSQRQRGFYKPDTSSIFPPRNQLIWPLSISAPSSKGWLS